MAFAGKRASAAPLRCVTTAKGEGRCRPCGHQGGAPVTSAGTEAIAPGVWVTENYVLPCQRTPERNPEAGEANTLPVP